MLRRLLEWDESSSSGTTQTGTSVLAWLIGDGELTQVVSNHIRLDLNLDVALTVVHTNNGSNHLGEDDLVAHVSLDRLRLLVLGSLLLCPPQSLEKLGASLGCVSTCKVSACTCMEEVHQFGMSQIQQLVNLITAVEETTERNLSSLLNLLSLNIRILSCRLMGA